MNTRSYTLELERNLRDARQIVKNLEDEAKMNREFARTESVRLHALIVKQSEALSFQRWGLEQVSADPKGAMMSRLDEALALTPADLADCVVVKRSDFERRVIAAPMRCSKCGKMVESPTTGFSLNTCFSCGGEMKTCRRPDTLEGALIRIEELEEDSLRIANGSEVARLREAIKWDKTQDDLEAAELFVLHDEIAALKAKCEEAEKHRGFVKDFLEDLAEYLGLEGQLCPADYLKSASEIRETFATLTERNAALEKALTETCGFMEESSLIGICTLTKSIRAVLAKNKEGK